MHLLPAGMLDSSSQINPASLQPWVLGEQRRGQSTPASHTVRGVSTVISPGLGDVETIRGLQACWRQLSAVSHPPRGCVYGREARLVSQGHPHLRQCGLCCFHPEAQPGMGLPLASQDVKVFWSVGIGMGDLCWVSTGDSPEVLGVPSQPFP